nr:sodium/hydrogen exchanger 3-like [Arachis hypogaea]
MTKRTREREIRHRRRKKRKMEKATMEREVATAASCTSRAISALHCCCRFYLALPDPLLLYCGHVFATLSFIAEIFIFLYVGMDALDIEKWRFISQSPGKSVGISSVLLGLILVGRAAFVFPLSFLSNLLQKSPHVKIDMKQQVTIWWSGLMRGAVSIALAYNQVK